MRRRARTEQCDERLAAFGGDREPAQLGVADVAQPREQRVAGARAQHLLGGPQRVAPSGRAHHRQVLERDARGGECRCVRQVRRREPDNAPARAGERGERGQHELQLAHALVLAEDFGERAGGPATAGQLAVERTIAARHDLGRGVSERAAAPHRLAAQDVFEACRGSAHGTCRTASILYFYTVSQRLARPNRPLKNGS